MKVFTLPLGALQTNCHVLASDGKAIVVDPADQCSKILAFLKKEELSLEGVVLTHCHFDHMGGVDELIEKSGAPLFCPEKDFPGLTDKKRNASYYFGQGLTVKAEPARLLKEGNVLCVGSETITVMETPGHTAGSICCVGTDFLISGDTLFCRGYGRTDLPSGDERALTASLRRILTMDDRTVYPGHGPATTIFGEKRFYGI